MRLLIIGHARHGKDTVAKMLHEEYGYTFKGSSEAAAEIFLYDVLKEKYGYTSPEQCFEDRVNRRKEWFEAICEFNKEDPARLAKEIMRTSDIYVGMRSDRELKKCLEDGVFFMVIGVFDPRKELESKESFDIDLWRWSDFVIPNSGTLEDLRNKIKKFFG